METSGFGDPIFLKGEIVFFGRDAILSSPLGWGFREDGILSFYMKGLIGVQCDGGFPPLWDGGLAKMASCLFM